MKAPHVSWSVYIRNGLGRRLSQVGQKFGIHILTYNYFVMRSFHDEGKKNAPLIFNPIIRHFPEAKRFMDVGSGSGVFAAELERRGGRVLALENSPHGRKLANQQGVRCVAFDLNCIPPAVVEESFDLIYCFEVAEHLPADLGDKLVDFIASFHVPVIFTAAPPGQGGTGHINEQLQQYWIDRFARFGLSYDKSLSQTLSREFDFAGASSWFGRNVCVFRPQMHTNI